MAVLPFVSALIPFSLLGRREIQINLLGIIMLVAYIVIVILRRAWENELKLCTSVSREEIQSTKMSECFGFAVT